MTVSIKDLRRAARKRIRSLKRPALMQLLGVAGTGITEDMEQILDDLPDDLQTNILELAGAKEPAPLPVPVPNKATRARWEAAANVLDHPDAFKARNERRKFERMVSDRQAANDAQRKAERRRVERIHEWRLGLKPLTEMDRRWMLANQGRNSLLTAWTPDAKSRRSITPSTFG